MELLGPIAVMSEGLGFNLCVAPFLTSVSLIYLRVKDGVCGQSWVRGAVLEMDRERPRSDRG